MTIKLDYDLLCKQINLVSHIALRRDDPEEQELLLDLLEFLDTIVMDKPFEEI